MVLRNRQTPGSNPLQDIIPITMRTQTGYWKWLLALITAVSITAANAGTATFDFEEDPRDLFADLNTNQPDDLWGGDDFHPWFNTGNPGGFLSITEAAGSLSTVAIFPDIDDGALVKGFNLKMDIRTGNGTTDRPADGFSISYARASDPVFEGSFSLPGPPENGTLTGIVVSFDTWQGNTLTDGSGDIEGIIVVVDGVAVNKTPLPTRHGDCDDVTSLQTGPIGDDVDTFRGDPTGLCWAPFEVDLNEIGELTVTYKGRVILDKFASNFFPSPGQLVIAGRTGGANEILHVDNIELNTILAESGEVLFSHFNAGLSGFDAGVRSVGGGSISANQIAVTLDGQAVDVDVSQDGEVTNIVYTQESVFAPNSEHVVNIKAGSTVDETLNFTAPDFALVTADNALSGDFSDRGFLMRVLQSPEGLGNSTALREQHLAGELTDANGDPLENIADDFFFDADGLVRIEGVINFDQDGANQGVFQDSGSGDATDVFDDFIPGIPGLEGGTDNITAEILTVVEIPEAGLYNFAFNSDDGFKTTLGSVNDAQNAVLVAEFDGGRGASTTFGTVLFEAPGFYKMRTIWYEGGGGANLEWWTADLDDNPIALLNDTDNGGLRTFREVPEDPAAITAFSPRDGAQRVDVAGTQLSLTVRNGSTSYESGSASATLNGADLSVDVTDNGDGVTISADTGELAFGTTYNWSIGFTAGGIDRSVSASFETEKDPASVALSDGMVALWNFDNEDFNDSVNEFHGDARGDGTIEFSDGRPGFGKALTLDAEQDQWVEITGGEPDDLSFSGGSMTLSTWFRAVDFDTNWQALVAKGEGTNWRVHRRGGEQGMAFAGGLGDTPTATGAGEDINDGEWHHLVAVSDADAVDFGTALYIDGELVASLADAPNLNTNGRPMAIGENPDANGRHWWGDIDDLALWNRVLSETEIQSIFNGAALQPPAAGPVALWNFDNGNFEDARGGFDGTPQGSADIEFIPGRDNFGQAILLDGVDQFVEITGGDPDDLAFEGGSMALSAWFRPDAFDKNWQAIIAKGEGTNWRVHRRGGEGGVGHAGGIGEGPAGTDIALGEWHHLVAVTDAEGVEFGTRLYIDGEIYSENTGAANLAANGQRVFLGENPDARGRYFTGALDEIALWDRLLSPAEVTALFTGEPLDGAVDNGAGTGGGGGTGPVVPPTPPVIPPAGELGPGSSISINFGADEPDGARSDVTGAAGIFGSEFWNNVDAAAGEAAGLVANIGGSAGLTDVSVSWESNNTWSSTGRGEENNSAPEGDDRNMMTGYLDTNNTSQTTVTVSGLPAGANYNVIVYAKGGVNGRGGEFTIGDQTQEKLDEEAFDGDLTAGRDYLIFSNLSGESFQIVGTPTLGGTPRAPINGIEIAFGAAPPPNPGGAPGAVDSITNNGDGTVTIEFTGTLQSADTVDGTYSAVAGASSPFTVGADSAAKFYIAR